MVNIFVDDIRETPAGFIHFYTVNDCVGYLRRMYKAGISTFYLDLDNDASDLYVNQGGDYINILKTLEELQHNGKYKDCLFYIFIHSMNVVGKENMMAYTRGYGFYLAGDNYE